MALGHRHLWRQRPVQLQNNLPVTDLRSSQYQPDQFHVILVEHLEEVEEILHGAADAVESGAQDGVYAAGANVGEEALELRAAQRVLPLGNGIKPSGGHWQLLIQTQKVAHALHSQDSNATAIVTPAQ
jgi:hypothetical protein